MPADRSHRTSACAESPMAPGGKAWPPWLLPGLLDGGVGLARAPETRTVKNQIGSAGLGAARAGFRHMVRAETRTQAWPPCATRFYRDAVEWSCLPACHQQPPTTQKISPPTSVLRNLPVTHHTRFSDLRARDHASQATFAPYRHTHFGNPALPIAGSPSKADLVRTVVLQLESADKSTSSWRTAGSVFSAQ